MQIFSFIHAQNIGTQIIEHHLNIETEPNWNNLHLNINRDINVKIYELHSE